MARLLACTVAALLAASAADHRPPAETRPAALRPGAPSILPGGRIIAPAGKHYATGFGSFSLAINPKGNIVAAGSAVISRDKEGWHTKKFTEITSLGLAFEDDNDLFASEGETGKVVLLDSRSGKLKQTYDLNQGDYRNSRAGDLAYDAAAKRLYILDTANSRLAIVDTAAKRIVSSVAAGPAPFALALAPGGKRVYVTSPGTVDVVDVSTAARPEVIKRIPAGPALGVFATADRVFVSNAYDDSVSIIDAVSLAVVAVIPMRLGGLEAYRGLLPIGLHYDAASKWLLVACAGINAVAVIDVDKRIVLGLIPTAWFPTRVATKDGTLWVNCAKGYGTGPTASRADLRAGASVDDHRQGALLTLALPDASDLPPYTGTVFSANGLAPRSSPTAALPAAVKHVVVIVKENRSYDEVLGDIESASNGPVAGLPILARFGRFGVVNNRRGEFQQRLGLRNISVTPNHHALAKRFAFSDNFYADSENDTDGHRWLAGAYPGALADAGLADLQPEAALLWRHLDRHRVSYRKFGEFDMSVPDQTRADRFIKEMDETYAKPGQTPPRLIFIRLPNDHMADARPDDGYPFPASFVADNDYALGRIVEYLSQSPWWPKMAIFVTEDDARGGLDHIDSHRTILLAIGPYAKRDYVSHVNTSFPGLIKTALRLLGLPPLNLFDATAADLADCFQATADLEPYQAQPVPAEVFEIRRPIK